VATISVPGFLVNWRTQLVARSALAGVPVYIVDRGSWSDDEAVVLSRVTMTGARWLGWGAGAASHATIEPLTLAGYIFARLAGSDAIADAAALTRVGVLLGEVIQQLRDDPTVGGDLAPSVRYQPPRMESALWGAWPGEQQGAAIIRVRVDFSIVWQAIS
jgi:hypothetical protein